MSILPSRLQPAFSALWAIDLAMADVVAGSTEPALGAIRLAWWREALQRLDQSAPPSEPRLQAVTEHLFPHDVRGAELAKLEECWAVLLEPFPWATMAAELVRVRGRILFSIGARLLDRTGTEVEDAGAIWSLVDVARHCSDPASREMLFNEARKSVAELGPRRLSRDVRPLTATAAVAAHDALGGSGIGRGAVALLHSLTGRFPRD